MCGGLRARVSAYEDMCACRSARMPAYTRVCVRLCTCVRIRRCACPYAVYGDACACACARNCVRHYAGVRVSVCVGTRARARERMPVRKRAFEAHLPYSPHSPYSPCTRTPRNTQRICADDGRCINGKTATVFRERIRSESNKIDESPRRNSPRPILGPFCETPGLC
jgi:hypothetical protein